MEEIKTVYVAGPIAAPTVYEMIENCRRACDLALELSRAGYAVICVHAQAAFEIRRTHAEATGERHRQVMHQDLSLVRLSDAIVLVTEDYRGSQGTADEVTCARSDGKPVLTREQALDLAT